MCRVEEKGGGVAVGLALNSWFASIGAERIAYESV